MAESQTGPMKRLKQVEKNVRNLEGAIVQITEVLIDQSERMDAGFRAVREEMHGLRGEMHGLREDVHGLQRGFGAVTDRLDRLIEITIKERTLGLERLLELERRLTRLEQHAGFD